MRWLPYVPDAREADVNGPIASALSMLRLSVDALEEAVADTEPAPVSIVLIQSPDGGKVHRAARIEGIPGLMTYEGDNMDSADFRVVPDLSKLSDESDLCRRCFGVLDDVLAQDAD